LDIAGQNIPSAIFSLEMSKSEIEEKILSYKTGITYEKIRNPQRLSEDEKLSMNKFLSKGKNSERLFLFDRKFTLSEIESTIKGLSKREKVKAILVDYLGLIKPTAKNIDSREREISHLSNSLKILAKETETIIFVLSQLNRSGIKEASSINLAESIALARESDFLFTIYKPEASGYNKIKMNNKEISINENNFIVKLDSSRHTPSGKEFLLELSYSGKMKEIETRYDLTYLNEVREPFEI
jgi:replicative DNA helicase